MAGEKVGGMGITNKTIMKWGCLTRDGRGLTLVLKTNPRGES